MSEVYDKDHNKLSEEHLAKIKRFGFVIVRIDFQEESAEGLTYWETRNLAILDQEHLDRAIEFGNEVHSVKDSSSYALANVRYVRSEARRRKSIPQNEAEQSNQELWEETSE